MPKLCQIIAITNSRKSAVQKEVTKLHHQATKDALLQGISRTYTPKDENGEKQPPENKMVQVKAVDALCTAAGAWTSLLDVVATQDWANCEAKADVTVDGRPLLRGVPVTHLLFLEKRLQDVHTFVEKLPTLDPAQTWVYDANRGVFRTEPVEQLRTQKVQEPLVLYHPTKEHPAQTQVVSKDVVVGTWATTHFSARCRPTRSGKCCTASRSCRRPSPSPASRPTRSKCRTSPSGRRSSTTSSGAVEGGGVNDGPRANGSGRAAGFTRRAVLSYRIRSVS